jgi:hypothetical protein
MSKANSKGVTQNVTDWMITRRANNNVGVTSLPSGRARVGSVATTLMRWPPADAQRVSLRAHLSHYQLLFRWRVQFGLTGRQAPQTGVALADGVANEMAALIPRTR